MMSVAVTFSISLSSSSLCFDFKSSFQLGDVPDRCGRTEACEASTMRHFLQRNSGPEALLARAGRKTSHFLSLSIPRRVPFLEALQLQFFSRFSKKCNDMTSSGQHEMNLSVKFLLGHFA